ncbi:MAG: xanthine dehydrogenase accessory factor [Clostridia bacterium]|nr:xanthine dehydrogenase accessory factor [Clostridia bacterium]
MQTLTFWRQVADCLAKGETALLATVIATPAGRNWLGRKMLIYADGLSTGILPAGELEAAVKEAAGGTLQRRRPEVLSLETEWGQTEIFLHPLLPLPHLIIFGGGHVGQKVAALAHLLDYRVTIIDDRPEFANRGLFPAAERIICSPYAAAASELKINPATYIVIVTRGHRYDLECLKAVIDKPSAYLGMIGSRRRVKGVLEQLAIEGYPAEALARIHAPIGLNIGAETPAEIAVSIMAEIIQVYRQNHKGGGGWDETLIKNLLSLLEQGEQFVLATVVRVQGSAPREPGVQMLITRDGRLLGTIGGGCAEADVRRRALTVLDRGQPELCRLNLTADLAAEEGMVCGGVMEVFLEPLAVSEASTSGAR